MPGSSVEVNFSEQNLSGGGIRTILSLKEALTRQNCSELETALTEAFNNNKTEIILDCRALSFFDSAALELILRMHEELKSRGGSLRLVALNEVCMDILTATRLINVLHVYKDIHGAIRR